MTALLDANVLIALVVAEHVHHDAAAEWLSASDADLRRARSHREVLFDSCCGRGNPRQLRGMSSAQSRVRRATSSGPTVSLSLMWRLAVWSVTDR